jgi:hypothetical protein
MFNLPDDFDYINGKIVEMDDRIRFFNDKNHELQDLLDKVNPKIAIASRKMSLI